MSKRLINKGPFFSTFAVEYTVKEPNKEALEQEIKEFLAANTLKDEYHESSYMLKEIQWYNSPTGNSTLLLERVEAYSIIDEDFENDPKFDEFLDHIADKYQHIVRVPWYYYSK